MVNKRNNGGQLKIQQMAFMLLAVLLFFILVGLFYVTIQYRNLGKQATQLGEEKAISTSLILADSPEFTYAEESYSVDTDKLMSLIERRAYESLWPETIVSIEVRKIYPKAGNGECNKANYPDCNIFNIYDKDVQSKSSRGSFVALCRKEVEGDYLIKKCELGKIIVGYEIK